MLNERSLPGKLASELDREIFRLFGGGYCAIDTIWLVERSCVEFVPRKFPFRLRNLGVQKFRASQQHPPTIYLLSKCVPSPSQKQKSSSRNWPVTRANPSNNSSTTHKTLTSSVSNTHASTTCALRLPTSLPPCPAMPFYLSAHA